MTPSEPGPQLLFSGPTALFRAVALLEAAGYACAVVPAPAEAASPCGLALAVRAEDLEAVRTLLGALRAAPRALWTPSAHART
jgi:hypothetical protein